jgi:hypothetical protein
MFISISDKISTIFGRYLFWVDNLIGTLFPLPWYQMSPVRNGDIPLQPFDAFIYDFFLRTSLAFFTTLYLVGFMVWYSLGYFNIQDQSTKLAFIKGMNKYFVNVSRFVILNFLALGVSIFLLFLHEVFFPQHINVGYVNTPTRWGISYSYTDTGYLISTTITLIFIVTLLTILIFNLRKLNRNLELTSKGSKRIFLISNAIFYGLFSYLIFVLQRFSQSRAISYSVPRNIYPTQLPVLILWIFVFLTGMTIFFVSKLIYQKFIIINQ